MNDLFIKLLDLLRIKRAIWIKLYDGSVELTYIDKKTPFGITAYRFPIVKVSHIGLNEDGTCRHSYIDNWTYYRE